MNSQQPIAYFNSNSNENYLCFGEGNRLILKDNVDFERLQQFFDSCKDKFIYGYIGYDVKNSIEKLSSENSHQLEFPDIYFHVPETVVKLKNNDLEFIQGIDTKEARDFVRLFQKQLDCEMAEKIHPFQARISKNEYISAVNDLKQQIQQGNIYEINFCQEYFSDNNTIENPIAVYSVINQVTQAPFSVYLQHDDFHIFCGSPERFIQKKGTKITSQPIKGTAPRGKTQKEDEELKQYLANNPKEISENVMIVDLVRNDLSKIAEKGSVNVDELFGIYTYKTVHQMISTISCEISNTVTFTDVLKATFPMGSMTGAPKVSAMKLSEQYESFKRGLYSGTIGYILPNGDFDFNVVIRTLLYNSKKKYLSCGVGGAITINSDAEKEYEECETKVQKLLNALTN
jgi:para-aminobenzoate synthetase component 1